MLCCTTQCMCLPTRGARESLLRRNSWTKVSPSVTVDWMRGPELPQREPKDSDETIDFVRKQELDRALERVERLQKENERLRQRIRKLEQELEAARRREHRSAAPYSRGRRKEKPQRNGRKPGKQYGQHHRRCTPEQVDEQYRAAT